MGAPASIVTPDGAHVSYRDYGSGRRSLVLVHGWMTSGAVFDDFVGALDSGLRVIVPDLVGSGSSSRPATGHALVRYAADVLAVIEDAGLERPALLGHSMGGQIAQLVAAGIPEGLSGLVLVNPVPLSGLALPDDTRALFGSAAGDAGKLGAILDLATVALDPASRERLVKIAMAVSEACMLESLDAWIAGGFEERLADVRARTLVVATDDPFLSREVLQREVVGRIAGARLEHLPGAGHYPVVERPRELAALVTRFLDTL